MVQSVPIYCVYIFLSLFIGMFRLTFVSTFSTFLYSPFCNYTFLHFSLISILHDSSSGNYVTAAFIDIYDVTNDAKSTLECNHVNDFQDDTRKMTFLKKHSHPNGFYWGHQISCTLTPAISMKQVSIMQFDNCNRK